MALHPSVRPGFHRHIHGTYIPGGIYFVTTYVKGRIPFFRQTALATQLGEVIWYSRRIHRAVLYAYVIMPDHLHLLVQPTITTISAILHSIKTNSSREIRRIRRNPHNGGIDTSVMGVEHMEDGTSFTWQKGFYDHVIRDERDFRTHVEYIRNNPVKAGLCQTPEEYPFLYVDRNAIGRILVGG